MSIWLRERRRDGRSVTRKLERLRQADVNYDPAGEHTPEQGWRIDDHRTPLPAESPGPPEPEGPFAIAKRLMSGYEFADPSLVHAYYDHAEPLEGRTMLLELRFHRLLRIDSGTRVVEVYEGERTLDGRPAYVWGWAYRTLEGHIEAGQMNWEVWKITETGELVFRIHSYSRRSADRNPILRLGFRLFGRREQLTFLHSTLRRMERLTRAALESGPEGVRESAERLTERSGMPTGAASDRLAGRIRG